MTRNRSPWLAGWLTALALAPAAWLGSAAAQETPAPAPAAAAPVNGRDLPAREFLELVRYPQFLNAWARMRGTIHHKAAGREVKVPIELRARFKPTEWRMQVILNDAERWLVRQIPADGRVGTTKILQQPAPADGVALTTLMIPPTDVTLSFLYYDFEKELDAETVSMLHCRVLQLADQGADERVRVWVSTDAFFPVRVQKFKLAATEPYLQLDFKGLLEVKSTVNPQTRFNLVNEVLVANPGWKTRVRFDKADVSGDEVDDTHPAPADLFVETPAPPVGP